MPFVSCSPLVCARKYRESFREPFSNSTLSTLESLKMPAKQRKIAMMGYRSVGGYSRANSSPYQSTLRSFVTDEWRFFRNMEKKLYSFLHFVPISNVFRFIICALTTILSLTFSVTWPQSEFSDTISMLGLVYFELVSGRVVGSIFVRRMLHIIRISMVRIVNCVFVLFFLGVGLLSVYCASRL